VKPQKKILTDQGEKTIYRPIKTAAKVGRLLSQSEKDIKLK